MRPRFRPIRAISAAPAWLPAPACIWWSRWGFRSTTRRCVAPAWATGKTTYASWEDFLARNGLSPTDERLHLLTKKARRTYAQSTYRDGDYLVFGSESSGIPEPLLAAASERCERIPMLRDCDSLDNAEAWEAHEESLGHIEDGHEAILRQDICGNFVNPDDYRISALNLSNSAAIVLYEALRQAGFPGM